MASLSLLLAHIPCAVSLFGAHLTNQCNESLVHSEIFLQCALAGFLQTCEDLNKDKIRSKQINQDRQFLPCPAYGYGGDGRILLNV